MNSKYLTEGSIVHISTAKSHLPQRNFKVLEVHPLGIIVQSAASKTAPVSFVGFHQMENCEIATHTTAETGIKTTAGVTMAKKERHAAARA